MLKKYVALLRGINVGKAKRVSMNELSSCFNSFGATNVHTVLTTGNIIFESERTPSVKSIENVLQKQFGFTIPVILLTQQDFLSIISVNPLKNSLMSSDTHIYVTFLGNSSSVSSGERQDSFKIIPINHLAIFSTCRKGSTPDLMKELEKQYGKNITTRNWNTVQKIAALL